MLSPTLFCLSINQLAEHIQSTGKHGIQMLSGLIELFILLFEDDVTLLSTTPSGLQNQLNCLQDCCVKMGMEVNEGKKNKGSSFPLNILANTRSGIMLLNP